jgi:hypothetical protein
MWPKNKSQAPNPSTQEMYVQAFTDNATEKWGRIVWLESDITIYFSHKAVFE